MNALLRVPSRDRNRVPPTQRTTLYVPYAPYVSYAPYLSYRPSEELPIPILRYGGVRVAITSYADSGPDICLRTAFGAINA